MSSVLSLGILCPTTGNVNSMVKFINKQLRQLVGEIPTGMLQFYVKIGKISKAEETLKIITKEMFPHTQELRLVIDEDDMINVKIIQNKEEVIISVGSIPISVYDLSSRVNHMIKQIWYKINYLIKNGIDLKHMYGIKIIIPIYDEKTEEAVKEVVSSLSQDFESENIGDDVVQSEALETEEVIDNIDQSENLEAEKVVSFRLYSLKMMIKDADIEVKVVDGKVIEFLIIF